MIKKGTIRDLEMIDRLTIMIIKDMKKSNIPQWNYPYPRYKVFMRDLLKNGLFVMKDAHFIQGSITVLPENDKAYLTIDSWQGKNALVIHRFMVDPRYRNQGVASKLLEYAIKLAKDGGYDSIKIDTHQQNYKMRRFLEKHGFQELDYLPTIDRLAYEKILEETV
jgi:GNAT superfamily N-acetyltransferase